MFIMYTSLDVKGRCICVSYMGHLDECVFVCVCVCVYDDLFTGIIVHVHNKTGPFQVVVRLSCCCSFVLH